MMPGACLTSLASPALLGMHLISFLLYLAMDVMGLHLLFCHLVQ